VLPTTSATGAAYAHHVARRASLLLVLGAIACAPSPAREAPPVRPTDAPRFSLRFVRGVVPFAYDYEPWLASVRGLDAVIAEVDERDVETYEVGSSPSRCTELRLTSSATERLQKRRDELLEVPVLVRLDGALLYAGREYLPHGAAAIRFPVVFLDRLGRRIVRTCGSLVPGGETEARRVDRPELRTLFGSLGRLRETR